MATENENENENEKFREARKHTPSPHHPDEGLSRQELAELANAWIWEHHNKKVSAISANYIGKLEQGVISWPGKLYREAFRAVLGASSDAALGFVNTQRAVVKLDNVKRKQFFPAATLGIGSLALGGPLARLLEGGEPTPIPVPARVGASDIAQIRTATRVFQGWCFTYGGVPVRDAAMAQLRWSARLLKASCPDRLRPELFAAVGDLADTAAYIALDAGDYGEARWVFGFALSCAEQAKDWHLRATVLDSMWCQEIRTGQPDDALTAAEQALVRADRLTATEQAMLHTDRARALATMRRVQEALRALGTAEEHFAHATPDDDPPFMAYYNAAHHAGQTGKALVDLAILGHDPREATNQLTAAATGLTGTSRALCLTKLASLTMVTGDPLQAAALGTEALELASTLRSRHVTDNLRELVRYAAAHQDLEEVADLRHRIGTLLVCTDDPQEGAHPPQA